MCKESLVDFSNYEIYEDGRIYSKYWKKCLNGKLDKDGYVIVGLKDKFGKNKNYRLHRVIWYYFNGEIPNSMQVNHIDENKQNNHLINLNLLTPKENTNWGTGVERRSEKQKNNNLSKPILQFSINGDFLKEYSSLNEVRRNGFDQGNVCNCLKGRYKTAGGYIWKYA